MGPFFVCHLRHAIPMRFCPNHNPGIAAQLLQLPCLRVYTSDTGSQRLAPATLLYLEGSVTYTWFHLADGQRLLIPYTLKRFEALLPLPCFIRLHRRYLVNRLFIEQVNLGVTGGCVQLKTGQVLPVSRRRVGWVNQQLRE